MKKIMKTKLALFMLFACAGQLSSAPAEGVEGRVDTSVESSQTNVENNGSQFTDAELEAVMTPKPSKSLSQKINDKIFGKKSTSTADSAASQFGIYDEGADFNENKSSGSQPTTKRRRRKIKTQKADTVTEDQSTKMSDFLDNFTSDDAVDNTDQTQIITQPTVERQPQAQVSSSNQPTVDDNLSEPGKMFSGLSDAWAESDQAEFGAEVPQPEPETTKTFAKKTADSIAQWKKTTFDRLSFNKMWDKVKSQAQSMSDLIFAKKSVDSADLSGQDRKTADATMEQSIEDKIASIDLPSYDKINLNKKTLKKRNDGRRTIKTMLQMRKPIVENVASSPMQELKDVGFTDEQITIFKKQSVQEEKDQLLYDIKTVAQKNGYISDADFSEIIGDYFGPQSDTNPVQTSTFEETSPLTSEQLRSSSIAG